MVFKWVEDIYLLNQIKAFTLIEIIIVVVILGIIAAVALPRITRNVDKARAAEAFGYASTISKAFNRCLDEQTGGLRSADSDDVSAWSTSAALGVSLPVSQNFAYRVGVSNNGTELELYSRPTAVPVAPVFSSLFAGGFVPDNINFVFHTDGTVEKFCTGKYSAMCKD